MKEALEEGLRNVHRMEEYIDNNFNNVKTRIYLHSWLDQIKVALSVAIVNTKEVLNYGQKIETNIKLDLAREEIQETKKHVLYAKDIIQNIKDILQKEMKGYEEYHKNMLIKLSESRREKNGR